MGRSVVVSDTGKMLISTMKNKDEPNAYGDTQDLSALTSVLPSLRLKPVHFNSDKFIFRSNTIVKINNQYYSYVVQSRNLFLLSLARKTA